MNRLRHILPYTALTLCFAFLTFMMVEVILAKNPEIAETKGLQYDLVFQASHVDFSSMFTRQAGDGESDPEARTGTRDLALVGIICQSQTLSIVALTKQHQLPIISIRSGSRTLLYCRLII